MIQAPSKNDPNSKPLPVMRNLNAGATNGVDKIVGVSPWAVQIRTEILRVAKHACNILIQGPTGTGKELIARAIHDASPRHEQPLIPVDCAAIVPTLFESHMFGHVKGAFTGAQFAAKGCFRTADGGTLFLDEVGELDLAMQAKLLRVLEERVVIPVGEVNGIPVSLRMIAATNRDLANMVAQRIFREDLYYRLNVVNLQTQPLDERPEDIELLSTCFLSKLARDQKVTCKQLPRNSVQALQTHRWPGNVRQLQNVLERASVLSAENDTLTAESLHHILNDRSCCIECSNGKSANVRQISKIANDSDSENAVQSAVSLLSEANCAATKGDSEEGWLSLRALQRYHIQQTLQHTRYNQTHAAELLGVTRRALQGLIKRLELDPKDPKGPSKPPANPG